MLRLKIMLIIVMCSIIGQTIAATLNEVKITNNNNQAKVTLKFKQRVIYNFFSLHNPERIVIDIYKIDSAKKLHLEFSDKNIIKRIRTNKPINHQNLRIVLELTHKSYIQVKKIQVKENYNIALTLNGQQSTSIISTSRPKIKTSILSITPPANKIKNISKYRVTLVKHSVSKPTLKYSKTIDNRLTKNIKPVIVAIDAGHGGQDPGATGPNGLHEKNVTIAIARKLKTLLDTDTMFKPVLTRTGDYFISIMRRANIARKKGANVLVSIHADAALNHSARGASVWLLSSHRAKSEMTNWLERHEKQPNLLDSAGNLLANRQTDPYLSQAVLDLQFGYTQRVGYDIAVKVLTQLQQVVALHKHHPEYASLGILRSPDIPSLLVETVFISNTQEEKLLGNKVYQYKIANALYLGLRAYFLTHPLQNNLTTKNKPQVINNITNNNINRKKTIAYHKTKKPTIATSSHIVKRGETLYSIAHQYVVSIRAIQILNKLKKNNIWIGQQLSIPAK